MKINTEREDCFANVFSTCWSLNEKDCIGCNFYRTKEEAKESENRARKRLKSLSNEDQLYVTSKYGVKL